MNYKYQRRQIFGKRLKVPKDILNKVYNCYLSFNEFIDYQLEDKIPISCIKESDRRIVSKFGIDKCRELDWELINKSLYYNNINFRDILMSIDSKTEDINNTLYELVKNQIRSRDYTSKMRKVYANRLFDISQISDTNTRRIMNEFNDGKTTLKEMVSNWNLFKNKDLDFCLLNDNENQNHITSTMLKEFMSNYGNLVSLIIENNDIYTFINNIFSFNSKEDEKIYIKKFTDDILNKTLKGKDDSKSTIKLTDSQYKEIFMYSSAGNYLKLFHNDETSSISKELEKLPQDYISSINIPFSELLNSNIFYFINELGLKNIVDFDNENGNFLTKDNCKMLELIRNKYLNGNVDSPDERNFIDFYDENGMRRPYTKDEFYEIMRRIIVNRPSNITDDYRDLNGEFRTRNPELFISEQAPMELQNLFYTKQITPSIILEHPEYIEFLKGKNLNSCFEIISVNVKNNDEKTYFKSFWKFIGDKTDSDEFMKFIMEYSDVLDIVLNGKESNSYQYSIKFSIDDDMNNISSKINETLKKLIIEKGIIYPRHIPKNMKEEYPSLFLDENAPEELKKVFYNRTISTEFILSNPSYKEFLKNIDLGVLFKYIPVIAVNENNKYKGEISLIDGVKQVFGFDDTFDVMLLYGKYIEQVFSDTKFKDFKFNLKFTKDELLDEIDKRILKIIIDGKMKYDENIPIHFKKNNPTLFLGENIPQEIKNKFYNREFTLKDFSDNPKLFEMFDKTNIACGFSENISWIIPLFEDLDDFEKANYSRMKVILAYSKIQDVILQQVFKYPIVELGSSINMEKMKYISDVFSKLSLSDSSATVILNGKLGMQLFKSNNLDELDKQFLKIIIDCNMKYDENIPTHFKKNNPTLFLGENIPQEIKNKFYNREFTLKNFSDNPKLFEMFDKTNIACGFSENISWIIPLFEDLGDFEKANYSRMKVISSYFKIHDIVLQNKFKELVMSFDSTISVDKIEEISEVLSRLSLSNSSEMFTFRYELATQLLNSNNPLESLNKIENVFIKNDIPTVGKIYSCFDILHPDFQGLNFESTTISPVLKKSSIASKKIIVFSDLIKSSFGSNNKSINDYLKNIEFGSKLYESMKSGQIQFDSLSEMEKHELLIFRNHLATLYDNTMKGKSENDTFISSENILNDIMELSKRLSPNGTLDYNLADRVVKMFCGFTRIDTLEQAKRYVEKKVKTADLRNREVSKSDMVLEQGDFIKGIGKITYLRNILQNGCVSKEYLGSNSDSDRTPLDTDVSIITSAEGTIKEKMSATAANDYGPIWFVLKNDDRFITTRTNSETLDVKRDLSKMEVFYTGALGQDHYGIRTGFASSEINYIVMENYDSRVGLEIAMNGFYIPVANKEGKIVFTPKDYDELRTKMSGLSYFDENNYTFSENLITEETEYFAEQIEQNNYEVQAKREKINSVIKKALEELGLHLKTIIDGDLTEGFVELIDTGSTGRGTNKPGDGDFDFMMRLDKTILSNPTKLNELKQTILRNLGRENSIELTGTGDFRLKGVQIDTDMSVDIDITFTEKTDKVSYSTDMALQDRLTTIAKNDPEKYKYVVANILLAKKVLKKAEAYKPNRGDVPQGGLGGVGIENWILQNGGSFIDAAKSFVEASEGKSFEEFKTIYQIWDFGDNHLAERRGQYSHDNFVVNNMSESGYQKMLQALKDYLKNVEYTQNNTEVIKR